MLPLRMIALVIPLAAAEGSKAIAAEGGVFGLGRDTCGGFASTFATLDRDVATARTADAIIRLNASARSLEGEYLDWAQGFMSALNIQRDLQGQPEVNLNDARYRADEQLYFLEEYCLAHEDRLFWEAVQVLFGNIHARLSGQATR